MIEQVLKIREVLASNSATETKLARILVLLVAICLLVYFGNYFLSKMMKGFNGGNVVYILIVGGVALLLVLLYSVVQTHNDSNKAKKLVNTNLINASIVKDRNFIPTKDEETNLIVHGACNKEIVKIKIALKGKKKAVITSLNLEGEQYIALMNSISKEFKGDINLKEAVLEKEESESQIKLKISGYSYIFSTVTDKNENIKVESTKTKIKQKTITIN